MNNSVLKEDVGPYIFIANIDDRNRITIPAEIVELIRVKKGDKVSLKLFRTHRLVKGVE